MVHNVYVFNELAIMSSNNVTWTPWGMSHSIDAVCRGVRWVSTPGHGGLAISRALAEKKLSQAALSIGEFANGYYWYEEDCACMVPIFECPKFDDRPFDAEEFKESIQRFFPEYFERLSNGFAMPKLPDVGVKVKTTKDIAFGLFVLKEGSEGVVTKKMGRYFHVHFNNAYATYRFLRWHFERDSPDIIAI